MHAYTYTLQIQIRSNETNKKHQESSRPPMRRIFLHQRVIPIVTRTAHCCCLHTHTYTNQNRAKQTTNTNRTLKIVSTAYVTDLFAPTRHIDYHVSFRATFCEIHAHDLRDEKRCNLPRPAHRLWKTTLYERNIRSVLSQSISAKCSTDLHKYMHTNQQRHNEVEAH